MSHSTPLAHHAAPSPRSRRRLLWAAVAGSGLLTGVYWTFPPIFAEAERYDSTVNAASMLPSRGLARSGIDSSSLPDIPITPSITAHRRSIGLLEQGIKRLEAASGYTAVFHKQEVVGGEMTEMQMMQLKLRHAPFSVYMKWTEGKPGQELLYVDGQNDGDMVVRPGGLKGRILGAIKLNPNGTMAKGESRHPITQAGLLQLSHRILDSRYNEANWTSGYSCTEDTSEVDGRPCYRFTIVYDSPQHRADYRKSVIWIDQEQLFVSKIENFGWPSDDNLPASRLDAETLIELYSYTNVNFDKQLAAIDFNVANESYGLRRR